VAQLQVDLRRLGFVTGASGAGSFDRVTILTGLPRIVERYAAERALTESVLSIAAIGPFGLAGGAVAMVATLLVRQRRAALALARGRGASGTLLLGTQLWEALVLAGGAALVGLLAAVTLVDARGSPLSQVLAVAVGGLAGLILLAASWPLARRPLGQLERDDTPVLRVPPRRLVIEATIVAVAVGATLLLRERGLTVDAPDGLARADPLLASVPMLGGLAAGIVALRLYPLPIRALGWLAARRRDFVPVLGLRTIGRGPSVANLPLLVLMLTAAFGAFSSVVASSLDRGQVSASYLKVGADYRVEAVGLGALAPASDPAAIPGVEAVAAGWVDTSAAFASTPKQRASISLGVVETRAHERVTAGSAAEPRWPAAFLAEPEGTGIGTEENPIPAILSFALPFGSADLVPGSTFRMTVHGVPMTFELVEERATFPGVRERASLAVVPFDWVQAATGAQALAPNVMWVRAPGDAAEQLAATFPEARGVVYIVSRYDAYAAIHDAPLAAAIGTGYGVALVLAAIYMALTIVGALILSAARRTRDLAYLRTLGVTARQALALTIVEQAVPVLLAIVPGVALGIGLAILCEPGLGLSTFVGTSGVPLFVDWGAIGLIAVALGGVVAGAVVVGTWLSRRVRLADALRVGED
jgi:putative ABC transport system permease protein